MSYMELGSAIGIVSNVFASLVLFQCKIYTRFSRKVILPPSVDKISEIIWPIVLKFL